VQPGRHLEFRRPLSTPGRIRDLAIPVKQVDALAVDRDLELLAVDPAEHGLEVAGHALDVERVLAIGRELVRDQDAAAGAERQPLDVMVLRRIRRHVEDPLGRRGHVADRQPADLAGRRKVRLHQRR
jgi:hypothetical protein